MKRTAHSAAKHALVAALVAALAPIANASPAVIAPRRTDAARVPYPPDAQGDATVVLVLLIDATGVVTDVNVREGTAPFSDAAAAAAKGWTFIPATRGDAPVAARILASVTFRAPERLDATAPREPTPAPPAPSAHATAQTPTSEVAVRGEREHPGTNHIPRSETRLIPGAFADPFRVVEALPGMAPWLSGLPYDYVRGSPPESVGYFIDGVRVPLLFHVGAGPSTIAPALVDTVDLFPGAYPAAYGRYAGAIIAGQTTPANADRARGEFDVRVFDASAFAETPLDGGRGTALAAGRYSYTGLLTSIIVPDYTVGYWDYQVRLSHRVFGRDNLTLFVFGARDELTYKRAPTFSVEYHRADLRYDHPLSRGTVRLAATYHYDDTLTALQTSTGAGEAAALRATGGRLRAETEQRVSAEALAHGGADFAVDRFTVDRYGAVIHDPHTDIEAGAYADVVWRPASRVELVPGLRVDAYRVRDQTVIAPQPRLAVKVRLTRAVSWVSALGVAHQEATEEVFVPAKLPYPIDHSDSYQLSEGVELRLPSSVRLSATAFSSRIIATGAASEEGAAGMEVFVRRDFTRRLGGFVSYTLSRSESATGGGAFTRSPWSRAHLVSTVLGYDMGRGWRVGARFFLESGRPYAAQCQTSNCTPAERLVTYRGDLPAFYRLDARLEKAWRFGGGKWLTGTAECFNVFDRAEPTSAQVIGGQGVRVVTQSPIILPSIGLEGGF